MKVPFFPLICLCVTAFASFSFASEALIISVNVVGESNYSNYTVTSTDSIGLEPQTNWINSSRFGGAVTLRDHAGTSLTGSTFQSTGSGPSSANSGSVATAALKMMNSSYRPGSAPSSSTALTGGLGFVALPVEFAASPYNVIVYTKGTGTIGLRNLDRQENTPQTDLYWRVGASHTLYGTGTVTEHRDFATYGFVDATDTGIGNYFVVKNVKGRHLAFLNANPGAAPSTIGTLGIAGIQIVKMPDANADLMPDADADLIPDAYERARTGSLSILGQGTGDADGNGVLDYVEYALGSDPLDAGSSPLMRVEPGIGQIAVSYQERELPPWLSLALESSPDLVGWEPAAGTSVRLDLENGIWPRTHTVPFANGLPDRLFFRIRVVTDFSSPEISVMSFNIRTGTANDGFNSWPRRRDLVLETILRSAPDLLGLQEAVDFQVGFLAEHLPNYEFYSVARALGSGAEFCSIFFRKDRFEKVDEGTFWLSNTPQVVGSIGWDASYPRIVSWVMLKEVRSGLVFLFANTHFDHIGPVARVESARLVRARLAEIAEGAPVVLTGDFNCSEGSEPYLVLTGGENSLLDTFRQHFPVSNPASEYTFTGFGLSLGARIDWILSSRHWEIVSAEIDRHRGDDGRYPSDHDPVRARLRLKSSK